MDHVVVQEFVDTVNYAQNLETELGRLQKELINQQHLNKFLIISQKKKDDMITYLFEENRALKNDYKELKKTLNKQRLKSPKKQLSTNEFEKFQASASKLQIPSIQLSSSSSPQNEILLNPNQAKLMRKISNFPLIGLTDFSAKKKNKVYEDDLAYKTLLNMNLCKLIFRNVYSSPILFLSLYYSLFILLFYFTNPFSPLPSSFHTSNLLFFSFTLSFFLHSTTVYSIIHVL